MTGLLIFDKKLPIFIVNQRMIGVGLEPLPFKCSRRTKRDLDSPQVIVKPWIRRRCEGVSFITASNEEFISFLLCKNAPHWISRRFCPQRAHRIVWRCLCVPKKKSLTQQIAHCHVHIFSPSRRLSVCWLKDKSNLRGTRISPPQCFASERAAAAAEVAALLGKVEQQRYFRDTRTLQTLQS